MVYCKVRVNALTFVTLIFILVMQRADAGIIQNKPEISSILVET